MESWNFFAKKQQKGILILLCNAGLFFIYFIQFYIILFQLLTGFAIEWDNDDKERRLRNPFCPSSIHWEGKVIIFPSPW